MIETKDDYCCVLENKLYFGNMKLALDEEKLKKIGIKAIIDVIKYENKSKEIKHSEYFNFLHIEVIDTPLNNADWTEEGSKFIEEQIALNNPVYVHCAQGISRSASLIMHYLMTREKINLKDAFFKLKNLRVIVCPTTGFMKTLNLLDEKLFGKMSFGIDEYKLYCLKEEFPSVNENDIKQIFEKNKQFYNENKELYDKQALEKKCEPIGYKTVDDLIEKYGKEKLLLRQGCSLHHPFD